MAFDRKRIELVSPDGSKTIALDVEIAERPDQRERGLMYRTELADDTGMLFLFERAQPMAFWMKNTLIPLDIIFFDARGSLVSIASMLPCETDPCPMYPSGGDAQAALELPYGFISERGVSAGWQWRESSDRP